MKLYRSLFLATLFLSSLICASSNDHTFKHSHSNGDSVLDEVRIEYRVHEELVGFISCVKIPLLNNYALHSLYVYPEYRNKGYGMQLLTYACEYLKSIGANNIYIQPGPFELNKDGGLDNSIDDRTLKLQRLIKLYKNNQFHCTSKWAAPFVWLLYKAMRINEKAEYLMVKNIK